MSVNLQNNYYGFPTPISNVNPTPIVARRAPTANDNTYPIGQQWVYPATNAVYFLSSVVARVANWVLITASGGPGVFTTLVSTGQFNLDTTAVGVNTLGNLTGATSLAISVGTGGFTADGVGASSFAIGASSTTGDIDIGGSQTTGHIFIGNGAAMTGQITLGNSTGIQTLVIGAGSGGAKTIQIGSGSLGNQIQIGQGINTVSQTIGLGTGASGADSIVNILTGNGTAGTQTFNAVTGTRAGAVNIGTSATGAHAVTIGSIAALGGTSIRAGSTGGLSFNSSGNVTMVAATDTQASPTATSVINFNVGAATFTGFTTAAAGTQVFTITNAEASATSQILVSVANEGANDAQMSITRVNRGAGSFAVSVKNNGAAALNGNLTLTFWILN